MIVLETFFDECGVCGGDGIAEGAIVIVLETFLMNVEFVAAQVLLMVLVIVLEMF